MRYMMFIKYAAFHLQNLNFWKNQKNTETINTINIVNDSLVCYISV